MKLLKIFKLFVGVDVVSAAQSWAGSNLYYAAGLTTAQQNTLFTGLQASGVKVLRVWLDGKPTTRNIKRKKVDSMS